MYIMRLDDEAGGGASRGVGARDGVGGGGGVRERRAADLARGRIQQEAPGERDTSSSMDGSVGRSIDPSVGRSVGRSIDPSAGLSSIYRPFV